MHNAINALKSLLPKYHLPNGCKLVGPKPVFTVRALFSTNPEYMIKRTTDKFNAMMLLEGGKFGQIFYSLCKWKFFGPDLSTSFENLFSKLHLLSYSADCRAGAHSRPRSPLAINRSWVKASHCLTGNKFVHFCKIMKVYLSNW